MSGLKKYAINLFGRFVPNSIPNCESDHLLEFVRARYRLDTWGDSYFIDGLRSLTESVRNEAQLKLTARIVFKRRCFEFLIKRFQIEECLKANPKILNTEIKKPIFIVGLPRTGTTLLHRLLALDAHAKALYDWQTWLPIQVPDPDYQDFDPRFLRAKEFSKRNNRDSKLVRIHDQSPVLPAECNPLFQVSFASPIYSVVYNVPSYQRWLLSTDMTKPYMMYKKQLQLLSHKYLNAQWILKAPAHLSSLGALIQCFPDARIIQTHRSVEEIVPSASSRVYNLRRLSSSRVSRKYVGQQQLDALSKIANMAINEYEKQPSIEKQTFHVCYNELINSPISMIQRIYEYFGVPFSSEFQDKMHVFLRENQQDKHGIHKYSLGQFGLRKSQVCESFERYNERYRSYTD